MGHLERQGYFVLASGKKCQFDKLPPRDSQDIKEPCLNQKARICMNLVDDKGLLHKSSTSAFLCLGRQAETLDAQKTFIARPRSSASLAELQPRT